MNLQPPQTLDERIDEQLRWCDWAAFLRTHPSYLKGVIDLLPPSENQVDAVFRTRMIAWWAQSMGDQLCNAYCTEDPTREIYHIGVHFGDNPYGPNRGHWTLGPRYVDPLLAANPITWGALDGGVLVGRDKKPIDPHRIVNAPDHALPEKAWGEQMRRAEAQWFQNAEEAPIVVLEWSDNSTAAQATGHVLVHSWEATAEVLAMNGRDRRGIWGNRPSLRQFPEGLGKPPQFLLDRPDQSYLLRMMIHAPSQGLMAYRRAADLDKATSMEPGSSRPTSRL